MNRVYNRHQGSYTSLHAHAIDITVIATRHLYCSKTKSINVLQHIFGAVETPDCLGIKYQFENKIYN